MAAILSKRLTNISICALLDCGLLPPLTNREPFWIPQALDRIKGEPKA
jgi:hypothetical protein